MEIDAIFISIKTPNFEAMCKFFRDLEFDVDDSHDDQFCPLFSERGVKLLINDVIINLEEDVSMKANSAFNLFLFEFPLAKLMRLQERLGAVRQQGIYGVSYTFTTPDGGQIVILSD